MNIERIVTGFAGPIASGKTTVSSALAHAYNLPLANFGDYVRLVARERGLGQERDILQRVGTELFEKDLTSFCISVLSRAGWKPGSGVVVDGIRRKEAIEIIQKLTEPLKFILIYVSTEEQIRRVRLYLKGINTENKIIKADSHPTESQLIFLRKRADLVIDGAQPILELVHQIADFIEKMD